jgi:hypothetical protein
MGRKPGECLMGLLEGRVETITGEFNPEGVANTMWTYAKMGRKPGERLMGLLEGRSEVISGQFIPQGVANTLWAYVTMGRKPGESLMGLLEGRVETIAGEFNPQGVANTVWTYATMGRKPGEWLMGLLEGRVQFFISCDLEEGVRARMSDSFVSLQHRLGGACKATFVTQRTKASESQERVSDALRDMGLWVEDEFGCAKSGYSIDMRVQDRRLDGISSSGCTGGWTVEFDVSSHFLACRAATGATLMKRRHLELLVYTVVYG